MVEDIWSEICAVRPDHGAELGIDRNLGEVGDISERLEHRALRTLETTGEVDIADEAIGEGQPQPVATEVLDGSDS